MGDPSAALLAANKRLLQRRAAHRAAQRAAAGPDAVPWTEEAPAAAAAAAGARVPELPPHLGWGSAAETAVLRGLEGDGPSSSPLPTWEGEPDYAGGGDRTQREAAGIRCGEVAERHCPPSPCRAGAGGGVSGEAKSTPQPPANLGGGARLCGQRRPGVDTDPGATVRLYPDIALGMLRRNLAPAGRIWLLLQALDGDGRGWVTVDAARAALTGSGSPWRIVSWRQLRNLLREGEGIFWQWDEARIWLRSAAKTAVALGIARLQGRPVALPLRVLYGRLQVVKAHFFVSFHSGRKEGAGRPISRRTLERISGVPARTQRSYEKVTGIEKRRNIAIGEDYSKEALEQRAWRHGRAAFDFIDHQGFQGEPQRHYVAWWLPNSYSGCHRQCGKGRQRKVNREIDLVSKGRGNDPRRADRLFHPDGAKAAKVYDGQRDRFWPSGKAPLRDRRLWYTLAGSGERTAV